MKAEGSIPVPIHGHWHAAGRAAREPVSLSVTRIGESQQLHIATSAGESRYAGGSPVAISSRVGNVERRLTFEDGSVFATLDNDAVDTVFAGTPRSSSWVHGLESSLPWIAVAVIGTVLFAAAFVRFGIPYASEKIAHALPQRAGEVISSSTLEFLDEWLFEPSELDEPTRAQIEARLRERLLPSDARNDDIVYRLHFRDWTMGGEPVPNALALPSGDIVLTDAFVELCETDDEMDSVILHEIGHIVERHSLQRIVEATFIGAAAMLVTGDGGVMADMGVGLGSMLVGSYYSRGHETAADRYAFERMLELGIDPVAFGDIMARLSASLERDEADPAGGVGGEPDTEPEPEDDDAGVLDYLASHPDSGDRIEQAERFSQCFRAGLTRCELE